MAKLGALTSFNTTDWSDASDGTGSSGISAGLLTVNCGNSYGQRGTAVTWDITNSYGHARVTVPASGAFLVQLQVIKSGSWGGYAILCYDDGTIRFGKGGDTVDITYDATAHRWWQCRVSADGDTIYFETAPDGASSAVPGSWTVRRTIAGVNDPTTPPWDGTIVYVNCAISNNGTADQVATFDHFNAAAASGVVKTINGLARASIKTVNGLAAASVKTRRGLAF